MKRREEFRGIKEENGGGKKKIPAHAVHEGGTRHRIVTITPTIPITAKNLISAISESVH